jgi:hypothetical protein
MDVWGVLNVAGSGGLMTNPMTTRGDIITAATGGTPQRLALGAANQVLTSNGTDAVWANSPAGFANPMSAKGDLIYGLAGGTAARLAIGTAGQQLIVGSSGIPAWTSAPALVVLPSGDTSGVTDAANIQAANSALAATLLGGTIQLAAGDYYITGVTLNQQCSGSGTNGENPVSLAGSGPGTEIFVVGGGTGISMHRVAGYGAQFGNPAQGVVGFLRDFVLDGTNATANAVGIDFGDGWGYELNALTIQNFTATGSIAVQMINRVFWTEKYYVRVNLINNLNPWVMTRLGTADFSMEYGHMYFNLFIGTNNAGTIMYNGIQVGFPTPAHVGGGINLGGCIIEMHGNVSSLPAGWSLATNPIAVLNFLNDDGAGHYSQLLDGELHFKVEPNAGVPASGNYPYGIFFSNVNCNITRCRGRITYSGGTTMASQLNGGEFSFSGTIQDTSLSGLETGPPGTTTTQTSAPAFPGFGVKQINYATDQMVIISGGGTTSITINGQNVAVTSGAFYVQARGSIQVNGAGANPTVYAWVPAGQQWPNN